MATNMNVPDYGAFFKQLDPVEQDTVKDVNDLQGTNYSFFNKIQDTVQQNTINPKFGQVGVGEGGGASKEENKPKNNSDGMYTSKELTDVIDRVVKGETSLQEATAYIQKPYLADSKNYITDEEGNKVFKESAFNEMNNIYQTSLGILNTKRAEAGKTTYDTKISIPYVKDEDLYKWEEANKQIRAANELNGGDFQQKIEGFMKQKDEWDAHKEKMSKFYGAQTGIGSTQDAVKTADGERSLLRSWAPIQGQQGTQEALKPLKKTYGDLTSEGLRGEKKSPGPQKQDTFMFTSNSLEKIDPVTYKTNVTNGRVSAANHSTNLYDMGNAINEATGYYNRSANIKDMNKAIAGGSEDKSALMNGFRKISNDVITNAYGKNASQDDVLFRIGVGSNKLQDKSQWGKPQQIRVNFGEKGAEKDITVLRKDGKVYVTGLYDNKGKKLSDQPLVSYMNKNRYNLIPNSQEQANLADKAKKFLPKNNLNDTELGFYTDGTVLNMIDNALQRNR